MAKNIECPIEGAPVNENAVRLTALLVLLTALLYVFINHWMLAGLLLVDFFQRAFNKGRWSPFAGLSRWLVKGLRLPYKPVDRGPKVFAAQVGFLITDMLFIFAMVELHGFGVYVAALIIFFAFLESFFGFCAGCYAYTFYKKVAAK